MPKTKGEDLEELLRRALTGLDAQIAELQNKRAQLAVLIEPAAAVPAIYAAAPRKQRKMSAEARAKISAAAKARWANRRKAQAENQQLKAPGKQAKAKGVKKRATAKKGEA